VLASLDDVKDVVMSVLVEEFGWLVRGGVNIASALGREMGILAKLDRVTLKNVPLDAVFEALRWVQQHVRPIFLRPGDTGRYFVDLQGGDVTVACRVRQLNLQSRVVQVHAANRVIMRPSGEPVLCLVAPSRWETCVRASEDDYAQ